MKTKYKIQDRIEFVSAGVKHVGSITYYSENYYIVEDDTKNKYIVATKEILGYCKSKLPLKYKEVLDSIYDNHSSSSSVLIELSKWHNLQFMDSECVEIYNYINNTPEGLENYLLYILDKINNSKLSEEVTS
ncbi:hypothetical protein LIS04_07 [Listeria phage LIS04]|nr:hypothetical protein LIS04_07 [Listeria phage LIS04]